MNGRTHTDGGIISEPIPDRAGVDRVADLIAERLASIPAEHRPSARVDVVVTFDRARDAAPELDELDDGPRIRSRVII